MKATTVLIENLGQRYSEILGINLRKGDDDEIFKWFLASVLFGAPISETSVIQTYRCFERRGVLTPERILKTGWDGLVEILDEGGYTRYDFKTSDKLLEVMNNLISKYNGSLSLLHEQALNSSDLEKRLKSLGKGVGEVTVSIFLRELRDLWEKADPKPTPLVVMAAKNLEVIREKSPERALKELKEFWRKNKVVGETFANFETALLRLGKDFCRKGKCKQCIVRGRCSVATLT